MRCPHRLLGMVRLSMALQDTTFQTHCNACHLAAPANTATPPANTSAEQLLGQPNFLFHWIEFQSPPVLICWQAHTTPVSSTINRCQFSRDGDRRTQARGDHLGGDAMSHDVANTSHGTDFSKQTSKRSKCC